MQKDKINKVQQQPLIANEHNLWKKNSYETMCSLGNIFKKFASQLKLPKLHKFLNTKLTALDVCSCSRHFEGRKGSWRPPSIPCRNAYEILSRLKKPVPDVYACSVG